MSRCPAHARPGEAITKLLSDGFVPRRTIILSHGNDEEEVFARRGQGHIAPFLEERYGKDGLLMVIDEGSGNKDDVSCVATATHDKREVLGSRMTVLRSELRSPRDGRERLHGHCGGLGYSPGLFADWNTGV